MEPYGMLLTVVERDVFPGLEEPELAYPLCGDAAGCQVGVAASLILQADVAKVDFFGKDRYAVRADLLKFGRAHQAQHNIEIVDHQVEDNVHIEASRAEEIQTVDLKK